MMKSDLKIWEIKEATSIIAPIIAYSEFPGNVWFSISRLEWRWGI